MNMINPEIPACLGGFCVLRDMCLHHVAPASREAPAERLCKRGHEGAMFFTRLPTELPKETK